VSKTNEMIDRRATRDVQFYTAKKEVTEYKTALWGLHTITV